MKKVSIVLFFILGSFLMLGCMDIDEPIIPTEPIITTEPTEPVDSTEEPVITVLTFEEKLDLILDDAEDINNVFSITITQHDTILGERYYGRNSKVTKNNVYSVTKSVTSLLVGIAIDQGYIESIDQGLGSFFDLQSYTNHEDLEKITIRHLLTMTDGITWDSSNLSGEMIALRSASDPLNYILGRDIQNQPGTRFSYSDGAAHLISMIISISTEMDTKEFAEAYLFEPLDITGVSWRTDQNGTPIGGCDLFLSSRDMIKIGSLILQNGIYNDIRIVSEEWIHEATKNQISHIASPGYGYYWWRSYYTSYEMISARGWGGQQIYIVPELDLVVTTASDGWVPDNQAISQFEDLEKIVVNRIIPLIIQEQS